MFKPNAPGPSLVARCLIVRYRPKSDNRWQMHDHHGHTIIADRDLWAVLRAAYKSGFAEATINDNGTLYLIQLTEME